MKRILYNPQSGEIRPMPPGAHDPNDALNLWKKNLEAIKRRDRLMEAELLVDTSSGATLPIVVEAPVQGGMAAEMCLARKRKEAAAGDSRTGEPAYVTPDAWAALSDEERRWYTARHTKDPHPKPAPKPEAEPKPVAAPAKR